jgi:hypothetical protein
MKELYMRKLLLLLVLTGCGMDAYRQLKSQPVSQEKYESDLKQCIAYSKAVRSNPDLGKSLVVGAAGPMGYVALDSMKEKTIHTLRAATNLRMNVYQVILPLREGSTDTLNYPCHNSGMGRKLRAIAIPLAASIIAPGIGTALGSTLSAGTLGAIGAAAGSAY